MTPELSGSGIPRSAEDVLVGLYVDAAAKIKRMVLEPSGGSEASRLWRQARASSMLGQIDREIGSLNAQVANWIGPNLRKAMIGGVARATSQMKDVGLSPKPFPPGGSLHLIDTGTMRVFSKDIYAHLSNASDSMGKTARAALRATAQHNLAEDQIDKILAGGVIGGQPRHTIAELRKTFQAVSGEKVVITDKNGDLIEFDAGYYARLVVRTKTREATVTARHDRLMQEGINLVSIVGKISVHFCTAYLGMVFSLDGKSRKYPALSDLPSGGPPFHPQCSKSTRPFVEDLATESELDMADGVDGVDKLVGVDQATAQRRFQDMQIGPQVRAKYASTARRLFGKAA